jgi:hypothetical protein
LNKKLLLALTTIQLFTSAFAHADWIRYQNYKVQFNVPAQWKVVTDLYGMPITLLGPDRGGERAVLSVQHTPTTNYTFDQKELARTQDDYYTGRKEWLETQEQGKFVSKIPYHALYQGTNLDGFEIGYRYQIHGNQFEERSVQVNCDGRLYLVKTLAGEKVTVSDRATLEKLVNQFQCANVTTKDGRYVPGPLHEIQDYLREQSVRNWPNTSDFKNASISQKGKALKALVEFYESYDSASQEYPDDSASLNSVHKNSAFASFRSQLLKLIPGASADDSNYDCFFGGWPSKFIKNASGHMTCDYPATQNDQYPKTDCTGQLACNPSLFGGGLCVDDNTPELRSHATLACELKFEDKGLTYDKVVADPKFDSALLEQTLTSAKFVCAKNDYATANYGLCHTLETKLADSTTANKHEKSPLDTDFAANLDKLKSPAFDNDLGTLATNYKNFESECIDDKGAFKADVAGCSEKLKDITADFERVEKTGQKGEKALAEATAPATPNNSNCASGNCGSIDGADTTVAGSSSDDTSGGSCSEKENKAKKDPKNACPWSKGGSWLSEGGSCLKNVTTALLNDLMGTVTAIPSLIKTVAKAGVSIFKSMFGTEDQTAKKAQLASGTSNSLLKRFAEHPLDTAQSTAMSAFRGAVEAISTFEKNDLFCEKWTGHPHTSTCTEPANMSCQSCMGMINGSCSLIGYVAAEVAQFALTGGGAKVAEGGGIVAKILAFLGRTSKDGELLKLSEETARAFPKLSKEAEGLKDGARVTRSASKSVDVVDKTAETMAKAEKVSKMKSALNALEKFKASFKSKFGSFANTLKTLKRYTYQYPKNALAWSVKKAGQVVKIPYKPYELASQMGMKTGQWAVDRSFVNAMKAEAAAEELAKAGEAAKAETKVAELAKLDAKAATEAKAESKKIAASKRIAKKKTTASTEVELASKVPAKFAFPEVNRIKKETETYAKQFDVLDHYEFDHAKTLGPKAKTLIENQKELLEKTKALQTATKKPITAAEHLAYLKKVQESSENFKAMDKNNQKLLALIKKDGGKIVLPVTEYTYSRRFKMLMLIPRVRVVPTTANAVSDVLSRTQYGKSDAEILAGAAAAHMSVDAYKMSLANSAAQTPTGLQTPTDAQSQADAKTTDELVQDLINTGGLLSDADMKRIPKGVTIQDLQQAAESLAADNAKAGYPTNQEATGVPDDDSTRAPGSSSETNPQ